MVKASATELLQGCLQSSLTLLSGPGFRDFWKGQHHTFLGTSQAKVKARPPVLLYPKFLS